MRSEFYKNSLFIGLFLLISQVDSFAQSELTGLKTSKIMNIDGKSDEAIWGLATWYSIDQTWVGSTPSATDFSGRYKVVWDADFLYVLAEITDEELSDDHTDPLTNWWDDDCIEIFIDEDYSKGNHQYNYNAFAYHISTRYDVVDIGTDKKPHLYNDHITTSLLKNENLYTWECKIKLFDDTFVYGAQNTASTLANDKVIGFSIAYNDNDAGTTRQSMIGSGVIALNDKNVGYITADYFQKLTLSDKNTLSIDAKTIKSGIEIFPNPSKNKTTIFIKDNTIHQLEIRNVLGNLVFSKKITAEGEIDFNSESLTSGVYFISAFSAENHFTQTLTIEK